MEPETGEKLTAAGQAAGLPITTARPVDLTDPQLMVAADLLAAAPAQKAGERPAIARVVDTEWTKVIVMNFAAGQFLAEHKAAHPIMVQAVTGKLHFTVGDRVEELTPGKLVTLPAYLVHRVDAPESATMMLTMMIRN